MTRPDDRTPIHAATPRHRSGAAPGPVRLRHEDGRLNLTFEGRFTPADLETVKSIPDRRWLPDPKAWSLPDTPQVAETLDRAFGTRLRAPGRPEPHGDAGAGAPPPDPEQILSAMRKVLRVREYSPRTARSYLDWARRFLRFLGDTAPAATEPDATHATRFLEHLATRQRLAAKSRNQAASALSFMFREVLGRDEMAGVARARGPKRVPAVLSHGEVIRVLRELSGKYFRVGALLYSGGLRLQECLSLRIKDVDFALRQILVRDGKGRKDRYVPLAQRAVGLLRDQIDLVAEIHQKDREAGHGWAPLPGALHRKEPNAGYELRWQFLFPASTLNTDPATSRQGRWSLHPTAVQRAVKAAVVRSGVSKPAKCHTFRHSFATEALRGGCDIRTLQHVMGHKDIRTTMIYLHVVEQSGAFMRSPLDRHDDTDDFDDTGGLRPGGLERQWELASKEVKPYRGGSR